MERTVQSGLSVNSYTYIGRGKLIQRYETRRYIVNIEYYTSYYTSKGMHAMFTIHIPL